MGQRAFTRHREVRKPRRKGGGEEPQRFFEHRLIAGAGQPMDRRVGAAARRAGLQHVAVEAARGERVDAPRREPCHRIREIVADTVRDHHEPAVRAAGEVHRLARRAQAGFDLGADRHPFHARAEDVGEPRVALVAAVVADALAEQARRHADARPIAHAIILRMSNRKPVSLAARLEDFSTAVTKWSGSSSAFALAMLIIVVWAIVGPVFHFSDTWQLAVNTGTTIITFLMVFLIQRSQNKDSHAIHLKLNELVGAMQGASNRLIDIEALTEKDLETLSRYYKELAKLARTEIDVTESHSVEEARERHSVKIGGAARPARARAGD